MKKSTWIALIIAGALILSGGLLFTGAFAEMNWNFENFLTESYEENTYLPEEPFKNITLETDTADIWFCPSEDDKAKVVCYERIKEKHLVRVEGDTLLIELQDERKWYDHIGISFKSPEITVYLPQADYNALLVDSSTGHTAINIGYNFQRIEISQSTGNVHCSASAAEGMKIKTSTGAINLRKVSAGEMDLRVSTGKVTLEDVTCKSLISAGNTGSVTLKNTIAQGKISIERSTGNVRLDHCDAAELFIKTDTGDVRGKLLSEKVFIPQTDTGWINVPKTITGGKCEVITDTGNIQFEIE